MVLLRNSTEFVQEIFLCWKLSIFVIVSQEKVFNEISKLHLFFFSYVVDSHSRSNGTRSLIDLFQVILSNDFPRLRICTTAGIEFLDSNEAWTGSPAIRCLILNVRTVVAYEQILFLCPNLRRFNSDSHLPIDLKIEGMIFFLFQQKFLFTLV